MLKGKFLNKNEKIVEGRNVKFTVKCDKCGADAQMVPVNYYEYQNNMNPTKVTLEIRCTECSNKFIAILYK